MNAKEIADRQRKSDIAHHENRIEWLSEDSPRFADGTLVPKDFVHFQLENSQRVLQSPILGYNTCHCAPGCAEA